MKKEKDSKIRTYPAEPTTTINGIIRDGIVFAQCKENRNKGTATAGEYPIWLLGDDGAPGKDHAR
jgi:hypothetical protein